MNSIIFLIKCSTILFTINKHVGVPVATATADLTRCGRSRAGRDP